MRTDGARIRRWEAGLLGSTDLVEAWKQTAVLRVAEEQRSRAGARNFKFSVSPGFVVLAGAIGLSSGFAGAVLTLFGLTSALVVQELPRVLLARALGRSSSVAFSTLGSETQISGPPLGGARAFSFAMLGSLANLGLGVSILFWLRREPAFMAPSLRSIAVWHIVWGGLQCIPLVPFRAGFALNERLRPGRRFAHASASVALEAFIGVLAVGVSRSTLVAAACVVALFGAAHVLRRAYRDSCDADADVESLVQNAESELLQDRPARCIQLSRNALHVARAPSARERLSRTLAWAAIAEGDPFLAHHALRLLPTKALDVHLVAAYLGCCNRVNEAIELLQRARASGQRAQATTKLWIDLSFQGGDRTAALALARADRDLLSSDELRAVESASGSDHRSHCLNKLDERSFR